ncbi:MAG: hypothetical protein JXR94_01925 [Candidatus Hydrogenedentes bacterium]|nr:hypothetical protein [Candidatus Hydrogenedentota bacterium]
MRCRAYALAMVCVAVAGAAWAVPDAVLVVESRGESAIVSAEADAGELREALGVAAAAAPIALQATLLDGPAGPAPLVSQAGPEDGGLLRITVLMPEGVTQGRVRLSPASAEAPSPGLPAGMTPVTVRQEGEGVIVNNGFVEVVHDPQRQGGLPSRVTFLGTGKSFEGFLLNDRVYEKGLGSFSLREDAGATVRVVESGPLEAVVEVRARYLRGGAAPESNPRAVYRFVYQALTPAVAVVADVQQDTPFQWNELHLMEWNFPSRPLPHWAGGTPRESGSFTQDEWSHQVGGWGALSDGEHTFGMVSGPVRLYSGTPTYGSYIHGPWVSWAGTHEALSCTLWLSVAEGAVERLERQASTGSGLSSAYVSTSEAQRLRTEIDTWLTRGLKGRENSLHRWWLSLTERLLMRRGILGAAEQALTTQRHCLEAGAGADAILADVQRLFDTGPVQVGEKLAILWGGPDSGCSPFSVFSLDAGRELLSGGVAGLWEIDTDDAERGGCSLTNDSEGFACDVHVSDTAPELTATWRGRGEDAEGLTVTLTSRLAEGACHLKLDVDNQSERRSVLQVTFPRVSLGRLGSDPADDTLFVPTVSGALAHASMLNGVDARADYPSGWGSLQYVALWDADCALYLGVHDPKASIKEIRVSRDEGAPGVEVAVDWPAPDATRPGNGFEHPGEVVLASFQGHWYDAAQIYRTWAEAEAEWWPHRGEWGRPDTPAWMKEVCVWACAHGGPDTVVEQVKRFAEFMGVPTAVHWYVWHEIPFDNNYPHYFPAKPGFAEGVAALQEAGVRVMPYINGRLWDSDTEDFEALALPGTAKRKNGEYYVEHYGSNPEDLVPMCPTQPVWRDKVQEIVLRLLGPECNVDGVYIDQVAAAAPARCYDASHGHPLAGGHWWTVDGYWPMLAELNQAIDERFPDKMLTTECTAEPYVHLFDGYLTWHYQYKNAVPAIAAVYGGKIQLFGRAYRGEEQLAHRMKTGQALVFGEQLGWLDPGIVDSQPDAATYLRRCARVRHRLLDYLAKGRMARPPVVAGEIPEVTADWAWSGHWPITDSALQCAAWRAENGSTAFIFANSTEEPLAFAWDFDAKAYGLGGGPLTAERVDESGRESLGGVDASFHRDMKLEPLEVSAIVISR